MRFVTRPDQVEQVHREDATPDFVFLQERNGLRVLFEVVQELRMMAFVLSDESGHGVQQPLRIEHDQAWIRI